jgi:hypothetical protein
MASSFDGVEFTVIVPNSEKTYPDVEWTPPYWTYSCSALVTSQANMNALKGKTSLVDFDELWGTVTAFPHVRGGSGEGALIVPKKRGSHHTFAEAYLLDIQPKVHAKARDVWIVDLRFAVVSDPTP